MKKKIIGLIGAVAILLVGIIAYFRPLSLSTAVRENCNIYVILNEIGYVVGNSAIRSESYEDLTDKQKSDILSVLEEYTYQRTLATPFSDGTLSGTWDKDLLIYMFDGHSWHDSFTVTSSGEIRVDGKIYRMENAEQFIAQILAIVRPAE